MPSGPTYEASSLSNDVDVAASAHGRHSGLVLEFRQQQITVNVHLLLNICVAINPNYSTFSYCKSRGALGTDFQERVNVLLHVLQ